MKKVSLYLATLFLCSSIFFTGCESDPEPTADDTISGPTGANRPDWIDPDTISASSMGSGPLTPRDTAFDRGMNGGLDRQDQILATIQFGFDEFTVPSGERGKLDQVSSYMQSNPNSKVIAEGHTDWYGTTEYNLGLGDRRANAVRDYIVRQGINANRVEVLSLGELEADPDLPKTDPMVIDDRRVDVILVE